MYIEKQVNNLFVEKKSNYIDIFCYYISLAVYDESKYCEMLLSTFKKTIFSIVKGTLSAFTDDNKSYFVQDIAKIRDIGKLRFDEFKFIQSINQLVKNLSKVSSCFEYYYSYHLRYLNIHKARLSDVPTPVLEANKRFLEIFSNKKTVFYETLEKKYTKVMKVFHNFIKGLNIRNMTNIAVYNCLFLEYCKFNFNLDYSKYLSLQTKNLVLDNLKYQVIGSIKKVGFILGGDNWKRVALQDDHE
jgi:hypothetical protein